HVLCVFFFFNDTATTEIYTLSLHDALPICTPCRNGCRLRWPSRPGPASPPDRKSTRLNSSHANISYAVFCLKKNNNTALHREAIALHQRPAEAGVRRDGT